MLSGTPDICYDTMKVKIFNRWGQLVYESEEPYFQWDGKNLKGKDCTSRHLFYFSRGLLRKQIPWRGASHKRSHTCGKTILLAVIKITPFDKGFHTSEEFYVNRKPMLVLVHCF